MGLLGFVVKDAIWNVIKLIACCIMGAVIMAAGFGCVSMAIPVTHHSGAGGIPGSLVVPGGGTTITTSDGGTLTAPTILGGGFYSDLDRYLLARTCWAPDNAEIGTAVSIAENQLGDPNLVSPPNDDGSHDAGLWQDNGGPHGELWAPYGGLAAVLVPQTNVRMACDIWHAGGWRRWSTYTSGRYLAFLDRARKARALGELSSTPVASAQYVFPLPGWHGAINLHWGTAAGGSDLFAPRGQPVVSVGAGTVIEAGWDHVGGNEVLVRGSDGLQYYYAHFMAAPLVSHGQQVVAGTPLGFVGNTGDADGGPTHLHIGIGVTILLGADATGGTGSGFDAVTFLRGLYAAAQN